MESGELLYMIIGAFKLADKKWIAFVDGYDGTAINIFT